MGAVHGLWQWDQHHKQGTELYNNLQLNYNLQSTAPALLSPPVAEELLLLHDGATAVDRLVRRAVSARRNVVSAACRLNKPIPLLCAANGRCQSLYEADVA